MNFFEYCESRFVSSQLALQNREATATGGLAVSHATKAHMWVLLRLASIFHFVLLPIQYVGTLLRLLPAPSSAHELVRDAQITKQQQDAMAEKVSRDIMKAAMTPRAQDGLDDVPRSGTS